ncbi:hypothetical protein ABAC460_04580 [Asticcacaulis sp. AC460]|uniref:MmcQ/YjbR family DNA-binding protein n=1 Tax=Asticcacaulis sp. AC460 TaxID=1282360 RepID=UPI0003C3EDC1|nr:MmcQ/YjbR family DNA-binding protein [Asticcacaulis sp. AC460]ESQ92168.1 hypothetical protein ABAC460_04580 [Asticcacaulis sp. AC460]
MTPEAFRDLALSFPEAEAASHFDSADARVRNKIFASRIDQDIAVLKLTPEQQQMLCEAEPEIFEPVKNAWGAKGWTQFHSTRADNATATSALWMAWRNTAPKSLLKQHTQTEF